MGKLKLKIWNEVVKVIAKNLFNGFNKFDENLSIEDDKCRFIIKKEDILKFLK